MNDFSEGTLSELMDIMRRLRGEGGCSWDQAQTHVSLKPCLSEEAQEVLDGIDIYEQTGDWENLCEELGDLLLQVVLHSVIAEEEGIFTIEDVIHGISQKMVRRHPHVFGDGKVRSWEEIKAEEKALKKPAVQNI